MYDVPMYEELYFFKDAVLKEVQIWEFGINLEFVEKGRKSNNISLNTNRPEDTFTQDKKGKCYQDYNTLVSLINERVVSYEIQQDLLLLHFKKASIGLDIIKDQYEVFTLHHNNNCFVV